MVMQLRFNLAYIAMFDRRMVVADLALADMAVVILFSADIFAAYMLVTDESVAGMAMVNMFVADVSMFVAMERSHYPLVPGGPQAMRVIHTGD